MRGIKVRFRGQWDRRNATLTLAEDIAYSDGEKEEFDLVVGADGQWSSTRNMMLGPGSPDPVTFLGVYIAYFTAPLRQREGEEYNGTIYVAPDKRVMFKIKHERTADCVVAGYRVHKSGPDAIGSLLLGLYKDDGGLASVGVIGAFPMKRRQELFRELQPLVTDFDDHPWAWAKQEEGTRTPQNAAGSRWAAGKDLSFTPLRPERVVEVRYDHMEGVRFRHTAQFVRWRPERDPESCTYSQLEEPVSYDLADVLDA